MVADQEDVFYYLTVMNEMFTRLAQFFDYSKKLATYEGGDQFDHDAARGFIKLHGLSQQTQARLQLLKGGKGFDLPGLMKPKE